MVGKRRKEMVITSIIVIIAREAAVQVRLNGNSGMMMVRITQDEDM